MVTLAQQALDDIWAFADLIEFRGGSDNFYDLHKEMTDFNCRQQTYRDNKREYRRRICLVPREHFKSTVNTVLYSLWRVYRNPDIRIIVGCCNKELAKAFLREIRQYFENPDLIENVWNSRPHIKGPLIPDIKNARNNYRRTNNDTDALDSKIVWSNWQLQVNRPLIDKQPTLEATSVGMSLTGRHCDLVILDDIVNFDNSKTDTKCQNLRTWAHDLESVLTKKARLTEISPGFSEYVGNEILINGTRYYQWDYYAHFVGNSPEEQEERLAKTKYSLFIRDVYVNGVDDTDGFICPEIFDAESVEDLLESESVSPEVFSCQYRNKVVGSSSDSIINQDNIRVIMPVNYKRTKVANIINFIDTHNTMESGAPKVFPIAVKCYADLATDTTKTRDKSTYVIGGHDQLNRFHIIAASKGKWTPTKHYEKLYEACVHWGLTHFYFESGVGYQKAFKHNYQKWLKYTGQKSQIGCIESGVVRGISKNDRIRNNLGVHFENCTLLVHSHVSNSKDWKHEITFWDESVKNNVDDLLDTAEMVARNTRPTRLLRSKKDKSRYEAIRINKMFGGVR